MPNPVIVSVDRVASARRALLTGAAMALRAEAELLVVHVAPDAERAAQREVKLKDVLAESGLVGEVLTCWGQPPATVLSEVASADPASALCMATGAPGRMAGALLGSTAEAVLRAGAAPVLLVGPHARTAPRWECEELAVCVDGSPASEALVPVAAEWADTLAMPIRLSRS